MQLLEAPARFDPELVDEQRAAPRGTPAAPLPGGPLGTARASAGRGGRSRSGCSSTRPSSSPTSSASAPVLELRLDPLLERRESQLLELARCPVARTPRMRSPRAAAPARVPAPRRSFAARSSAPPSRGRLDEHARTGRDRAAPAPTVRAGSRAAASRGCRARAPSAAGRRSSAATSAPSAAGSRPRARRPGDRPRRRGRLEQEQREQRPLLLPAERQRPRPVRDFERAEDPKVSHVTFVTRVPVIEKAPPKLHFAALIGC